MGIGEAEAFSERLKRELQALEAANVHAILESEPLIDEVYLFFELIAFLLLVLPSFTLNGPLDSYFLLWLNFLPL